MRISDSHGNVIMYWSSDTVSLPANSFKITPRQGSAASDVCLYSSFET